MTNCRECENYLGENGCQEHSYGQIRPGDAINEHCEDRFEPRKKPLEYEGGA